MKKSNCFGIIPLTYRENYWEAFLIQHLNGGHWGFPKGHKEEDEDFLLSAQRELKEETNLTVDKFLDINHFEEEYIYERDGKYLKKVTYVCALVKGHVKLQENEILDGRWVFLEKAKDLITFQGSKSIADKLSIVLKA